GDGDLPQRRVLPPGMGVGGPRVLLHERRARRDGRRRGQDPHARLGHPGPGRSGAGQGFMHETNAIDHNLYVRDNTMYQSNYTSGLRVLDVSDPVNPVPVGHFDTVPYGGDLAEFNGSWSNYPYFESGIVIVTSQREGLFVVRYRPRSVS